MNIEIIREKVSLAQIKELALETFGNMVKAVVDVNREIMAIGGEMHVDSEALLIQDGSKQEDIWGINIYPNQDRSKWIEYISLINIRPRSGNRSMEIENAEIKDKIKKIINSLIE